MFQHTHLCFFSIKDDGKFTVMSFCIELSMEKEAGEEEGAAMLLSNLRRLKRDSLFHLRDLKGLEKYRESLFSNDIEEARHLHMQAAILFNDAKHQSIGKNSAIVEFLTLKLKLAKLYGELKEKCKENNILYY